MKPYDAVLELKTAGTTPGGAWVRQEVATTLAAFMADLIEDRKVLLAVVGISEEEFLAVRGAAELVAGLTGAKRKGTTK